MHNQHETPDAGLQAAHWLVRLADAPDDNILRVDFEKWLNAAPNHQQAWELAVSTYVMIGVSPRSVQTAPSPQSHKKRQPARHWQRRRTVYVAVTTAIAACITLMIMPSIILRLSADHITGTAETSDITLADGSRIILGPRSAVSISYQERQRRISLLSGEASFVVSPDKSRPFQVDAGEVRTTVLGTAFEVRKEQSGAWVSVAHGRVRVDSVGNAARLHQKLHAGDWLHVGATQKIESGHGASSDLPPERNMIIAKNRPIAELIDRLRPWYSGVIIVADAPTPNMRVTGAYDPRDPAKALSVLLSAHGGTVRRITPWVIIVSASIG